MSNVKHGPWKSTTATLPPRDLTERLVLGLPFSDGRPYQVRDSRVRGFYVNVGKTAKTYTVSLDVRVGGARKTRKQSFGRVGEVSLKEARAAAQDWIAGNRTGRIATRRDEPTLRDGWRLMQEELDAKGRSPLTVKQYRYCLEDVLEDWLDVPLRDMAENPLWARERHQSITRERGGTVANHTMRCLRATYRNARRVHLTLPPDHPCIAVLFNPDRRRDDALDGDGLRRWFGHLDELQNPVRRAFHLFTLLSAVRGHALIVARWEHVDVAGRRLRIPEPKGGAKRAYDVPLSRPMLRVLNEAKRAGAMLHPEQSRTWIFPAASRAGHMDAPREQHRPGFAFGNALRRTYRTHAVRAEINPLLVKVLLNHEIGRDVHDGYFSIPSMFRELLAAQERLSRHLMSHAQAD